MCGITGKIYFAKDKEVAVSQIEQMTNSIKHRGPDDDGVYISPDKKVGFGHRRLSIIDLSPLGHQPMSYLDRYWIVFNGEIYNYLEEKSKLLKLGYKFKSHSDTEIIMALYDKYGFKCLKHLRGMFSFALYDEKEKIIFCARDRVGKKPFKYYIDDNVFMFASELKAILTQKEYKKEPDYLAIHHYLTLQYVPSPLTGFKDIRKLEPAHFLLLDLKTKKLINKRYWKLDYSEKLDLSESEWKKNIIDKLEESIKIRMLASDVPVGAFLSGGIDSSAIVGLMSKNSTQKVKTFTISFQEKKFDESKYARIVAKKFKTDHTEFVVKPETIEILPQLVKQYEEPYADSSGLATYYLSKLTREHVTVALNGDGGDENFAGYGRYSVQKFALWYDKFKLLNKLAIPLSGFANNTFKTTFFERANRFMKSMDQDYRERYVNYICYFDNESKDRLYTDEFKNKIGNVNSSDLIVDKFNESGAKDKLDQTLYADFCSYLPDDLMVKVDIASMAASLEGRSPFLDQEFLELTAKIPFGLKLKGRNNKKYILKEALRDLVPDEVMFRPKMGFGIPIETWFKNDLAKFTEDILLSDTATSRGMFNREYIKWMLSEHQHTGTNYSSKIWALLTLELWFREYFS